MSQMADIDEVTFELMSQRRIATDVYEMLLAGDCSAITAPGQFVNVTVPGLFLRRPISVADVRRSVVIARADNECETSDVLVLIYKVVGSGTAALAAMMPGDHLDVLVGLGNGYTLDPHKLAASGTIDPAFSQVDRRRALLIGGGVGVPPLYWLARELCAAGADVQVVLGFNSHADVFYEDEFAALGCHVSVTTVDGSYGTPGFVTDTMPAPSDYDYFYTCGPLPMLHAVAQASGQTPGELSFEERMGCGFGACMGCTHEVKPLPQREAAAGVCDCDSGVDSEPHSSDSFASHAGDTNAQGTNLDTSHHTAPDTAGAHAAGSHGGVTYKRICAEGPVLRKEEVVWER